MKIISGDTPGVKDGVRYTGVYSSTCVADNSLITYVQLNIPSG